MDRDVSVKDRLTEILTSAKSVFVYTGAGASRESGLPTFRDEDGLWKQYDPMTLATLDGFMQDPVLVWNNYRLRQKQIAAAQPNPAHLTLAKMEGYYSEFLLATQNVDDLHERAGSRRIVKIHGDIRQIRCVACEDIFDANAFDMPDEFTKDTLPKCDGCGGLCRPNIVWFGEYVPREPLMTAVHAAANCDLMLVVGTSGEVSGGYGFAEYALANGAKIVEVNPNEGSLTHYAHVWVPEQAGVALPRMWELIEGGSSSLDDS